MIGLIARLKIKPGFEGDAKEACLKMAEKVRAEEKECHLYEPFVSADNSSEIVFLEKYTSVEALEQHRHTEHYKELGKALSKAIEGPPEIIVLKSL